MPAVTSGTLREKLDGVLAQLRKIGPLLTRAREAEQQARERVPWAQQQKRREELEAEQKSLEHARANLEQQARDARWRELAEERDRAVAEFSKALGGPLLDLARQIRDLDAQLTVAVQRRVVPRVVPPLVSEADTAVLRPLFEQVNLASQNRQLGRRAALERFYELDCFDVQPFLASFDPDKGERVNLRRDEVSR